jgi:N-acetylmuramoyl-L-alanine amidase
VFKVAVIISSGFFLLLAGCSTVPETEPSVPQVWAATNAPVRLVTPAKKYSSRPPAKRTSPTPTPPARTNLPPVKIVAPVPAPAPILTWTSLDRWAAEHKLAAPRKVASSPVASYAVNSAKGTFTLVIGSREAVWRGMEIHLGYAPEIIDDQVFVYGLDLQKNLEPLLLGQPLVFGTNRVAVIDPGHGGSNPGAKCVLDSRNEKEFTLDWAKRLKPLLETNGWKVILTRDSDIFVTNSLRPEIANTNHANLFISLHFNSAAPDKKEGGLETFCLTPAGLPSTLTRGFSDLLTDRFPNNAFDTDNLQLAVRLHNSLLWNTGQEDRGVRRARFMDVLHGARCPAVLIEGGFLSNPREAEKIESGEFRQKLAQAIADALK